MNILHTASCCPDFALFIIRVGIGFIFMKYGFLKIMAGTDKWIWLGQQLRVFGITFLPVVWGFIASCTEFFGGIALATGFATRFAAFFLGIVMSIALLYHYRNGDAWSVYAHPLSLLLICIAFIIGGAGTYSLDTFLSR